ncbi:MAG: dihydropteroate synthase [Bacteroidaceae bacterium]|nr:dihydropteroate synthase [Bacteroidaceae bacterium]
MLVDNINRKLSLNVGGRLLSLDRPQVMGILNVTPDSFYDGSRCPDAHTVSQRVTTLLEEGADIIDVGGYSSRPGCADVSVDEEKRRLAIAFEAIHRQAPDTIVSVDTFRAEVARWSVEEWGVHIINDISGGEMDDNMFATVARLQVPYIMMHMRGTPETMMHDRYLHYNDVVADVLQYFSVKIAHLVSMGVNDIILDPGLGFSKSLDDNYRLMQHLDEFTHIGLPLLVGISRKSMIYKLLDITPAESLNGTTVLNVMALLGGANILRVHDVRQAVEAVKLVTKTLQCTH